MSNYIIIGQGNSGKSTWACKKILELSQDKSRNYIMIVPEQYALQTEIDLINLSPAHGIMNIEVLSFTRLAYRLMEEACDQALPVLDDMGKTILLKKILRSLDEEMLVYKKKSGSVAFIDQIKSVVSELLSYRVSPEVLNPEIKDNLLSYKRADIALIYKTFTDKIKGLYTTSESLSELCFKHISASKVLKSCVVFFDGFTGFTPIQYEFINHLMNVAKDMYFTFAGDETLRLGEVVDASDVKDYEGIFSMTKESIEKLCNLSALNGRYVNKLGFEEYDNCAKGLSHLKKNIFRKTYTKSANDGSVSINSFKDKKQEAYFVAASISDLIRSKQYSFDDIAIVSGDLAGYGIYLKEALEKYNIAYYLDDTRSFENNTLINFIHNAMRVVESGFSRESVINFIKSPMSGYSKEEAALFENYITAYNYRGLSRYKQAFTYFKRLGKTIDLEKVNSIRMDLVEGLSGLKVGSEAYTAGDIIRSLYHFLQTFKVKEKLEELSGLIKDNKVSHGEELVKEYDKAYDAVISIFEKIDLISQDELLTIKEFDDLFMMGVRKAKLGLIPANNDLVIIGDVWRTRLKDIKAVFLVGANEGILPRIGGEGVIFSSSDKAKLKDQGINLAPVIKDDPYREEFYIYLVMSKPTDKLYISYTTLGDDGKEARPSLIINQVKNLYNDFKENAYTAGISHKLGFDQGLSYYLDNYGSEDSLAAALREYYIKNNKDADYTAEQIRELINHETIALSQKIASDLYGEKIQDSVTKLENFSSCQYKYFLRYGLGLEGRGDSEPNNLDYGIVFHDALKNFTSKISSDKELLGDEEYITSLAEDCITESVDKYKDQLYKDDKRFEYFAQMMKPVMEATSKAIVTQLLAGQYTINKTEHKFNLSGVNYFFRGTIDRIDTCQKDGETMLKVVDYKTGSTSISFVKLLEGISLQLPLYMNAALEIMGEATKPAAMFYQAIDNPIVEGEDPSKALGKKISELRPDGLSILDEKMIDLLDDSLVTSDKYNASITSDAIRFKTTSKSVPDSNVFSNPKWMTGEDLKQVSDFARDKVKTLSTEALSGSIKINPYKEGRSSTCDYCDYRGICGFDSKLKKYSYREINTSKPYELEAFQKIVKKNEEGDEE